jgi:hypothetical protein
MTFSERQSIAALPRFSHLHQGRERQSYCHISCSEATEYSTFLPIVLTRRLKKEKERDLEVPCEKVLKLSTRSVCSVEPCCPRRRDTLSEEQPF